MRIYLLRHGETAGNREHRYIGVTDDELTEEAIQKLLAMRGRYPAPDCVFASGMKRCLQTSQILFPKLDPELCTDLRECAFGEFEYRNYRELCGDRRYQAWIDSGGTLAFPGGESRDTFSDRCCAAFEECCRRALRQGADSAAFVVHGGTIMAILDRFSRPHRDYFDWQVPNAHGYICELVIEGRTEKSNAEEDLCSAGMGEERPAFLRVLSGLPLDAEAAGNEDQPAADRRGSDRTRTE